MLIPLGLASCSGLNNSDYRKSVKEGDFETAHAILDELHDEYEKVWAENYPKLDYDKKDLRAEIEAAATKYSNAASYVYGAEVRVIAAEYPDDAVNLIENLFNEMQLLGEKVPNGTGYYPGGVPDLQQICVRFDCYKQYVKYINAVCDVTQIWLSKNKMRVLLNLLYHIMLKMERW